MIAKFIDDGLPESSDFDDNYVTAGRAVAADAPPRREWRERKILRIDLRRGDTPGEIRLLQWMENRGAETSNLWKFDFLRRLLC